MAVAFSAGCSRKKKNDISEAKLRVGYIPITECAHLYVGISKGYFQKEGLQIELQPMKGGAVILPALQTGDLDIGFANVVSILAIDSVTNPSSGKFLKSLAGGTYERADHINHALLVKKDSRLEAKDLATTSVRIAVNTTKNIEELMLRRFLEMEGVHKPVLTLVSIGFPDMLPALDRGDVDVVSVVEPFIQPALRTGRYKLLATQYLKVSTNTAVATYAVTSQWLKANRDIAARFRRAFGRANDFINSNEPETREILASFTRIRREDLPLIGMPAFEAQLKRSALEELQEPMQRLNFISSPPPLDAILTDSE
ncbi:MAG TPA: ABC transporter substrate-binding protein [Chthoniobacterales bacterium]|nr:ABC transporter substrate-binding protein [Chthoniobacterales bacterium]